MSWYICTERAVHGGRRIGNGYSDQDTAIRARTLLETESGQSFWVMDESDLDCPAR